jgi:hypothetical protein
MLQNTTITKTARRFPPMQDHSSLRFIDFPLALRTILPPCYGIALYMYHRFLHTATGAVLFVHKSAPQAFPPPHPHSVKPNGCGQLFRQYRQKFLYRFLITLKESCMFPVFFSRCEEF